MTWKPPIPWKVRATRGWGASYVCAWYTYPTYDEAKRAALVLLQARIPWDYVRIFESAFAPKKRSSPRQPKKIPAVNRQSLLKL